MPSRSDEFRELVSRHNGSVMQAQNVRELSAMDEVYEGFDRELSTAMASGAAELGRIIAGIVKRSQSDNLKIQAGKLLLSMIESRDNQHLELEKMQQLKDEDLEALIREGAAQMMRDVPQYRQAALEDFVEDMDQLEEFEALMAERRRELEAKNQPRTIPIQTNDES